MLTPRRRWRFRYFYGILAAALRISLIEIAMGCFSRIVRMYYTAWIGFPCFTVTAGSVFIMIAMAIGRMGVIGFAFASFWFRVVYSPAFISTFATAVFMVAVISAFAATVIIAATAAFTATLIAAAVAIIIAATAAFTATTGSFVPTTVPAALSAAISNLNEFGFSALGDFFRESTQCQIGSFGIPLGLRGADRTMHNTDVKGV